ncbi:glycosyltransferase, partial [Flavihumibacter sp. CACIAM 22H1]|uniref:glycosyltransferase n=1 Tax=Flavihumibacter sp. CACIAM 22H1 TaxID=1812911 RepID=UPI0025C4026E
MNSGKTVCIVGPCLKMGGIERASSNVANGLSRLGYKVIYLAVFRQEKFFKLDDEIVFDEPPIGRNQTRLSILYTVKRIRERVRYYKPDTVLVYNKFYAALVAFALWSTEFQYYLSERSSPFFKWPLKIRILNRIAFFLNPPAGLIAQTTVAANYQKKYYGRKVAVEVIPNSLESVEYAECPLEARSILAVGRLNDYLKGFDRLIAAMKWVNPDWNLRIVGADKSPNSLDKLIREQGLENRIQLEPKSA